MTPLDREIADIAAAIIVADDAGQIDRANALHHRLDELLAERDRMRQLAEEAQRCA